MNTAELISLCASWLLIALIALLSLLLHELYLLFFFRHHRALFRRKKSHPRIRVVRHDKNPILSPDPDSAWEQMGTFNPAAYADDTGRVHLLYRALGADGISRVGYASCADGKTPDERLPYAVFTMKAPDKSGTYDPVQYPSGGSWGGSEDPRITPIDDKLYMTFNAFDGWDFIRIGVTSIKKKDFLSKRWTWSRPMLISPEGRVNKNWVLFPEKINGKFAILHSLTPQLQIEYVDRLESLAHGTHVIHSKHGQKMPRKGWDTWVRGAGPPPLKTDLGWLVLYHATTKEDPHKYQLGALLLDAEHPEKIIARSPSSLLMPHQWYENDWKQGVVYACGAVIQDNQLTIYYGGGDKHTCAAHVPLNELLHWLVHYGKEHAH